MISERGYWLSRDETDTHVFDEALCDAIIATFPVGSAVDIGCGDGRYVYALNVAGVLCDGYDGNPMTPELTGDRCAVKDFSDPVDIGQYDLVLCLEVGEHIPVKYEQAFLDNVCRASQEYICLSWAIEGQDGTGHVNCRNNGYIISEMQRRGFDIDWEHTEYLREKSMLPWFKNTVMVFERR